MFVGRWKTESGFRDRHSISVGEGWKTLADTRSKQRGCDESDETWTHGRMTDPRMNNIGRTSNSSQIYNEWATG
jgi:hypothetical protein